jgi:hypothetical protein
MQLYRWVVLTALVAWPAAAVAQDTTTTTTTTAPAVQTADLDDYDGPTDSHWLASGFVGSNFGRDSSEANVDFGGTLGYLWNGVLGAEFQANLSPDFELEGFRRALLVNEQPWINSYMINAMAAAPIGFDRQWQPFISGGFGALSLRADALLSEDGDQNEIRPDDTQAAGNIGGGIMGFMGNVGIRGEVRYFKGFDRADADVDPVESPAEAIGSQILSDLQFWRANIGVAFRW